MGRIVGWKVAESVRLQDIAELKDLQGVLEMLVNLHDGGLVSAAVAVVGSCEEKKSQFCHKINVIFAIISPSRAVFSRHSLFTDVPEKMVTTFLS